MVQAHPQQPPKTTVDTCRDYVDSVFGVDVFLRLLPRIAGLSNAARTSQLSWRTRIVGMEGS